MGKQVTFYMLPHDEQTFVDHVLSQSGVVMLGTAFLDKAPRIIERLPEHNEPDLWRWMVFFWDTGLPFMNRYNESQQGPHSGMDYLDRLRAHVIEFSRSGLREDGTLRRGRVWIETAYFEGEQLVYKDPRFVRWYDRIARWLRRRYRKLKPLIYIGPQADEWYQAGGKLGP
jgi:hypothetical protein